ncbi:MAG: hypothetical protein WDN03_13480 [Rhizomicrobium sp.]
MMTDTDLDALLAAPLPERDAGAFSVLLLERIAHDQARPARILSWVTVGILAVVIAAAAVFGAGARTAFDAGVMTVPAILTLLTLVLSYAVARSARE